MCQQGQMEIQQAYNDLTQTCNACQTQSNLKTLTSSGCQGCAQAQQVIQNVQNQAGGCSSCGQPTTFNQLQQGQMPQGFLQTGLTGMQPMMASQGLVQPMLTPLTGTGQQMLTTVIQQPGMQAGQLPIAIERGATTQGLVPTNQAFLQQQFTQPMMTTQPMITGMMTQPTPMPMQPVVTGMIPAPPQPMQPIVMTPPPAPVMQPVMQPTPVMQPLPPPPVQQPVMQPAPVQQPVQQPVFVPPPPTGNFANIPTFQYTPGGGLQITGAGGGTLGGVATTGGGTGKAPVTTVGLDVNTVSLGGSGYGFGGVGIGAFDTHRPDLHAGGGWHMTMPLGTESIFNLL